MTNEVENFDAAYLASLGEMEDQTETQEFSSEPPAAGDCLIRLVEYIELGVQPRKPFQGKEKSPAEQVQVGFEIVDKAHTKKGTDGLEHTDIIRMYLTKSFSGKSGFKKLFDTLRQGDESVKHMAQLINKSWKAKITHNKSDKTGKTYANLGNFSSPTATDFDTGEVKALNVPPAKYDIIVFVFDKPLKSMWTKLFIDGTTEDGKSKNFIQEKIMSAVNYAGSPVMQMLSGVTLPTTVTQDADTPATKQASTKKPPVVKQKPASIAPDVDSMATAAGLGA